MSLRTRIGARSAACALVALAAVQCLAIGTAVAATTGQWSSEVDGGTAAARAATAALQSAWSGAVAARGGTVDPTMRLLPPAATSGAVIAGVIGTAADGTTVSVQRGQYSAGPTAAFVNYSGTPGTASCSASGTQLQGGAPRPTTLVGTSSCTAGGGFGYTESGGPAIEAATRDGVEFSFSRPVLAFGAWFGDLETRTDGLGVAALLRLYGADGTLMSEQQIVPSEAFLPQASCANAVNGCGNNTTRWVGFVADPAHPVARMVVIVGDEDATGTALDEGIGFIGPTLDTTTATISLLKSSEPLTDSNGDGLIGAGDVVSYTFLVTNTGTATVSALAIADTGASDLSCPVVTLAATQSATCTGQHLLTLAEVDAGSLSNTATATALAYGGTIASTESTALAAIPSTPGLTLSKSFVEPSFAVGDVLHFELVASNTGNVTLSAVQIADVSPGDGAFSFACAPADLVPGGQMTCSGTYTATQTDVDAGQVRNTGSASATAPSGAPVGPVRAEVATSATQVRSLSVNKSVDQAEFDAAGDGLAYVIQVRNNGTVTLSGVSVIDPAPGSGAFSLDCSALPAVLAPGAGGQCIASYVVVEADLEAGLVSNTATASASGASAIDSTAVSMYRAPPTTSPSATPPPTASASPTSSPSATAATSASQAADPGVSPGPSPGDTPRDGLLIIGAGPTSELAITGASVAGRLAAGALACLIGAALLLAASDRSRWMPTRR